MRAFSFRLEHLFFLTLLFGVVGVIVAFIISDFGGADFYSRALRYSLYGTNFGVFLMVVFSVSRFIFAHRRTLK